MYSKTSIGFNFRSICLVADLNIHNMDLGYHLGQYCIFRLANKHIDLTLMSLTKVNNC